MSAVSDSFAPTFKLTDPTTVVILGAARSGLAASLFLKTLELQREIIITEGKRN